MTSAIQTLEVSNSLTSMEIDWPLDDEFLRSIHLDALHEELNSTAVTQSFEESCLHLQPPLPEIHEPLAKESSLMGEASLDLIGHANPIIPDISISECPPQLMVQAFPGNVRDLDGEGIPEVKSATEPAEGEVQAQLQFLRRKLQNGLLTEGQPPKAEDMDLLSRYLKKLERLGNLSASVILTTKIDKLLRKVGRLGEIPRNSELRFKERVMSLSKKWEGILEKEAQHELYKPTRSPLSEDSVLEISEPLAGDVTETFQSEVAMGSAESRHPARDKSAELDVVPDDEQPSLTLHSTPSPSPHVAVQHPPKRESQPVVIDLTDECEPDMTTRPELLGQQSTHQDTEFDAFQSTQNIELSSPLRTGDGVLAASRTSLENSSNPIFDTPSNTRKRKRCNATSCDSSVASDLHTNNSFPAHPGGSKQSRVTMAGTTTNKSTRTHQRRFRKTSPKKHLSDEIFWMSQSVKKIQEMIERSDGEIDAIKKKRARLLEEIRQEIESAESQRDSLTELKEHLLAWGAQDEKVTEEWEHSG